jgi:geranylgeranyl reductase family protein
MVVLMAEDYDVIVVGGGPSGSTCAAFLSKAGRKVLLLDRAKFPRDKTCGDGISGRSVSVLTELGVMDQVAKIEHEDMYGVTFSSPKGKVVPISAPAKEGKKAPGFVCRREVFDNLLFQNAKSLCAKTIEGFFVNDLIKDGDKVVGVKGTFEGKPMEFRAKIVVGADGAAGIVARKLGPVNTDEDHQAAAIRCYYEGVEGMIDQIELHFVDGILPGYFWIFPLPGKRANVGIGMLVSDMKKSKVNLQNAMQHVIENNPVFKERFAKAKRISDVKSWLLPLASKTPKLKIYGNGYVLIGDAASLIDPFTGEGIGNALTSGKISAQIIGKAFEKNDFSEAVLSEYAAALWERIGKEVKANYDLQNNAKSRWKMNLIIDKASRSKDIQAVISNALINPEGHSNLVDPIFILKAIFA